jgi:O-methyltransferase involved in polyketide biosynthesis
MPLENDAVGEYAVVEPNGDVSSTECLFCYIRRRKQTNLVIQITHASAKITAIFFTMPLRLVWQTAYNRIRVRGSFAVLLNRISRS